MLGDEQVLWEYVAVKFEAHQKWPDTGQQTPDTGNSKSQIFWKSCLGVGSAGWQMLEYVMWWSVTSSTSQARLHNHHIWERKSQKMLWPTWGLNPEPLCHEHNALPTELISHYKFFQYVSKWSANHGRAATHWSPLKLRHSVIMLFFEFPSCSSFPPHLWAVQLLSWWTAFLLTNSFLSWQMVSFLLKWMASSLNGWPFLSMDGLFSQWMASGWMASSLPQQTW